MKEVSAKVQPYDDGTVALIFEVVEAPVIKDVSVAGNNEVTNQELSSVVSLIKGTPVDRFQLDRTVRQIENLYRKKGYYQVNVTVDEKELNENGVVLFVIREGERLQITDIRFDGNLRFSERELRPNLKSETAGFLRSGTLDDTLLDVDVAALITFYKNRGYLDIRVDRRIQPAPNGRECSVSFIIEEGQLYTLRAIRIELRQSAEDRKNTRPGEGPAPVVISREQATGLLLIRPGDVYSIEKINRSVEALRNAYGQMGYVDSTIERADLRDPNNPVVDLYLQLSEGAPSKQGTVEIVGNGLTKTTVIRREVDVQPDRPLNTIAVRSTETRLQDLNLFAGARENRPAARVTIQPPDPTNPGYRDAVIEVEEKNTGSLSFGVAAGSDGGLIGQIALRQENFDIADTPDSAGEFFSGRAFRGAGQRFEIAIQPGTQISNYQISLFDPHVFDSEYSSGGSVFYRQREFDEYDEKRFGGRMSVGRSFGQRWGGSVSLRAENVDISNIARNAITDVYDVQGNSTITGVKLELRRNTTDFRVRPTKGSNLNLGFERVGALGGDYDFSVLSADYAVFFTVGEDYLGRKTILALKSNLAYIPESKDNVPIFERFFLGGRSFRGYAFRGVSPRGRSYAPGSPPVPGSPTVASNDPAGGTWSFFAGPELEQPLLDKVLSYVLFVDSGTVGYDAGFSDYRVAIGAGLRFNFPQLGPAPLAFDFGFPVVKQKGDRERVFSFSLDIPF